MSSVAIIEGATPPGLREVGHLACWSVTSAKPGNGVEILRDGRTDTFWQSDGLQPHIVSIQFEKRMALSELHIYLDFKLDESYTPNKLSVQAGSSYADVKELKVVDLEEPIGWVVVQLGTPMELPANQHDMQETDLPLLPLHAYVLQLAVISNHQNGRDTHVRQVKVFGCTADPLQALLGTPLPITSPEMAMYSIIR